MCGHGDWAMKEAWEGHGPAEWRCDLAQGLVCGWCHWPLDFVNNNYVVLLVWLIFGVWCFQTIQCSWCFCRVGMVWVWAWNKCLQPRIRSNNKSIGFIVIFFFHPYIMKKPHDSRSNISTLKRERGVLIGNNRVILYFKYLNHAWDLQSSSAPVCVIHVRITTLHTLDNCQNNYS